MKYDIETIESLRIRDKKAGLEEFHFCPFDNEHRNRFLMAVDLKYDRMIEELEIAEREK